MNWVPLLLMYMLSKHDERGHARAPHWPTPKHPPPRRPPVHPAAHHAATHHAAPAHHAATHPAAATQHVHHEAVHHHVEHEVPHVVHHAPMHHTTPELAHDVHPELTNFQSPFGPIAQAPVPVAPAEHAATPLQALHVAPPEPPAAESTSGTSIADIQSIERGLGWTGHLTTHGPVQPSLLDGEYGPVTHDNWQQSARKRGLDPTFVRLGPNTAQVDPGTYNALRALASQSGVSGFGGGARTLAGLYIP